MKEGSIVWGGSGRADIMYRDGTCHGGLHCGDYLEALIKNEWRPMRIEYSHDSEIWYLIDLERSNAISRILWLTVRK